MWEHVLLGKAKIRLFKLNYWYFDLTAQGCFEMVARVWRWGYPLDFANYIICNSINPTWEGVQIPWIGGGGAKLAPP